MLAALLLSVGVGVAASQLRGMSSIVLVSALTLTSAFLGPLSNGTDTLASIVIAVLVLATMQIAYVGGLLLVPGLAGTDANILAGKSR